jgi:hypothetical protein
MRICYLRVKATLRFAPALRGLDAEATDPRSLLGMAIKRCQMSRSQDYRLTYSNKGVLRVMMKGHSPTYAGWRVAEASAGPGRQAAVRGSRTPVLGSRRL